jgi:hypothetical protein
MSEKFQGAPWTKTENCRARMLDVRREAKPA